jgi:hypothetical protein
MHPLPCYKVSALVHLPQPHKSVTLYVTFYNFYWTKIMRLKLSVTKLILVLTTN